MCLDTANNVGAAETFDPRLCTSASRHPRYSRTLNTAFMRMHAGSTCKSVDLCMLVLDANTHCKGKAAVLLDFMAILKVKKGYKGVGPIYPSNYN